MNVLRCLICVGICLACALAVAEENQPEKRLLLSDRTLQGTYVFAGRVLLNPLAGAPTDQNPARLPVDCFSIGELEFDGRGGIKRRVEIRCPATENLLKTGLGGPAPVGEPTPAQLQIIGSTLTSEGSYEMGSDGWGSYEDTGFFRLGPVPGNPASGAGRIAVVTTRFGVAQQIVVLVDHQSLQPPGATQLINSDIGNSLIATRR